MTEPNSDEALHAELDEGVIMVRGDIDLAGGPVLETVMLQNETNTPLVLDLKEVRFIDSSGLRCLLSATRRAGERNETVVLRSVGPEVIRLLDITGTSGQFVIESSRD